MWDESKEWYGRVARLSHVFYKAVVREVEGLGIIWSVNDSDEVVARGTETDFGTAMHKAERTMFALTEGY
jgi:hypothetical protein